MVLVRVFGPLEIEVEGGPADLPASRRARALLAWLALRPGRHPRAKVAAQFWPDVLDSSARTSLRGALAELRRCLGPAAGALVTTRDTIELAGAPVTTVDVRDFLALTRDGRLEEALALVRGPLLADVDDEWVEPFRDEYERRLRSLLHQLSRRAEQAGRLPEAAEMARRRVDLDPLSEPTAREFIRLLDAAGDRAGALAAANALIDRLHRDLGLGPDAETLRLISQVRAGSPEAPVNPVAVNIPVPPAVARLDVTLVGREEVLREISSVQTESARTGAAVVVVFGDAGIGKTSLALTVAATTAREALPVLYGRCDEEGIVPYGPWVEAIGHVINHVPHEHINTLMRAGGPALVQLFPTLHDVLPPGSGQARAEPDTERWRLFEAMSGLLHDLFGSGGALVIDDVHWADRSTLLLLRHVLRFRRSDPLLVLMTCRNSELPEDSYLRTVLAEFRRDDMVTEIPLHGLSEDAVSELVKHRRGAPGERGFVRALHRETDGNPFFVQEILRGTLASSLATARTTTSGRFALPQGVRDVMNRRLAQLPAQVTDLLALAAVAGSDFELTMLERLSDLDSPRLLDCLDQAVASGAIIETGVGHYSFGHALFRSVLYDGLTRTRRARLHLAIARTLESMYGSGSSSRAGEIAHHYLAAADPAHLGRAMEYSRRAYAQAVERLAYEDAATIAGRAVDALDQARDEATAVAELPRMLVAVGDAQSRAGDFAAARRAYGRVVELADHAGDPALLAEAALGFAGPSWRTFSEVDQEAIALLERALRQLPHSEVALRTMVQARLAIKLYFARAPERVAELSRSAVAGARTLDDPAVLAVALESRLWAYWHPDAAQERLDTALELVRLCERHDMDEIAVVARRWRVVALVEAGRLADARAEAAEHARAARTLRLPYELMYTSVFNTARALLEGRLEDARLESARVAAYGELRGGADALQLVGVHDLTFGFLRGELGGLVDAIRRYADGYPALPAWRAALALALVEAGRLDDARAEVDRMWPPESALPRDAVWLPGMVVLALAAARLGDRARAEHLYQMLLPYADHPVVLGPNGAVWGIGALHLGLVAASLGDAERATKHLTAAGEWLRRTNAAPWLAIVEAARDSFRPAAGARQLA